MKSIRYKFRHFITSNRRPHVRRIRITAGGVRAARDPAGLATPKAGLRLAAGAFLLAAFLTAGPAIAASVDVEVTVENLAPANGTYLTPFWAGFHDGTFDTYNQGSPASTGLERLAEDGDTGPLSADFTASATGATQGTLNAIGPIPPGGKVSKRFSLDPQSSLARYFSYASMIIPSNDAFIANGNPTAHQIFDAGGGFLGADFVIQGSAVLDAGTEVNDELPANTAFFGQSAPDTGTAQGGNVDAHPGFNAAGSGGILDDPMFSAADFLAPNHQVARIRVTLLPPKPASVAVKIENLSPAAGTYLTPVWVGFHNGDFDVFSGGGPASAALERLAEDGDTAPLSAAFLASGQGTTETTILSGGTIPPLAPGQVASAAFTLDGNASRNRYLSFASMVIPSNDAFVGNGDPKAIMVFDSNGNLQAAEYLVMGSMVYDAGTEVNDEVPMNTAFLGQGTPDTGVVQNGVVSVHPGFNARGTGGILDQPMFENADFTAAGYRIFRISIAPALELTAISRSGDTVNLAWSGGQAPYQLQRRSALDQGDWANTGGPLNTMAATAGTADPMAYFRVVNGAHPTAQSARYRVTFNSVWSAATHPLDFPSNPHFSGLIGVTHNSSFTMWAPGLNATPGIRNMAETGSKQPLQTEVQAAITAGSGQNLLSGGGIGNSPGIVTLVFDIAQSHPLVSLTSMIAPSPDWFVGVHDLNLFANGTWAGELTVPLLGYDAGTDSGTSYGSANAVTSPAQPIQRINRPPLVGSSPAVPLGTFTFTRLE